MHPLSCGRQPGLAGTALKKLMANFFLKRFDMTAHGRLGKIVPPRGFRETPGIGQITKYF